MIVALAALGGLGCGGANEMSETRRSATVPAFGPRGDDAARRSAMVSLQAVKKRLVDAGYRLKSQPSSGHANATVAVLKRKVTIAQYTAAQHARADLDVFREFLPGPTVGTAFAIKGKRLYMLLSKRPLLASERSAFRRIVRLAETP